MTEHDTPSGVRVTQPVENDVPSQDLTDDPAPEDFLPSAPKPRGRLSHFPAQKTLIVPAAFYALCIFTSYLYWTSPNAKALPVSGASVFHDQQYYRLLTALFTHADIAHLLANGPLFLIFGWLLRSYFGSWVFPVTAFGVGILANLATIAVYPPEQTLVGASGMVYGMVAMWLVFYLKYETVYRFSLRLMRVMGFILIILFPTQFQPKTSYWAHTFGFIIGALAAWLWTCFRVERAIDQESNPNEERHSIGPASPSNPT